MDNDFSELSKTISALLEGLSPQSRSQALRKIAKTIKAQNQKRIRAQISPDNRPFEPRRKRPYFQPETTAKFLYPEHGTGQKRLVYLSSWTISGDTITGADEKSGGAVKSFKKSKIIKWLPSSTPAGEISSKMMSRLDKNRIKSRMFEKLRTNKYLKSKSNDSYLEIGFYGSAGKIASEHQFGLNSEIKTRAETKKIKMPRRELLGISDADEIEIMDEIIKMLENA